MKNNELDLEELTQVNGGQDTASFAEIDQSYLELRRRLYERGGSMELSDALAKDLTSLEATRRYRDISKSRLEGLLIRMRSRGELSFREVPLQ